MLDLYDVRSPERDAPIRLGRESRRRGWWTRYKDVFTGSYVALKSEAASIRINAHLVPGFRQTPAYARAVIAATGPWLETDDTERRVAARTARRDSLLNRNDPPDIRIVLDESVRFPDPEDAPVAYAEGTFGDVYLESKEEVERYEAAWSVLGNKALNPADSAALIRETAKETS